MARRSLKMILASAILIALLFPFAAGPEAVAQEEGAKVSASMKSYCYAPGERAYLEVEPQIPDALKGDSIDVDFLLYSSASTRSSLASFKEGTRRYPIIRRTLETIPPGGEWTAREYEIDPKTLGLRSGVYPFEVRLVQDGKRLCSDYNFLVIMDPGAGYPLNLSLLWTLDFLPAYDAQGNHLDGGLASACSSSATGTGFLLALARVLKQTPEVSSSMVLPYTTYQDLESLANLGGKEGAGDAEKSAAETLRLLDELFKSGQVDLMATTYAYADPDYLSSLGWEGEANEQMEKGSTGAEEINAGGKGFVAPLFHLSDSLLQRLAQDGRDFTVVGEEAVQSGAAGRRLLEGTTLSQPVKFISESGYLLKAFVRDEALFRYLEDTTQRDAFHMAQNIIAELAVLQREKPYVVRSCVLAFPTGFAPSRDFLEEFYGAVKGCPWLKARPLSDLNKDQFPLEDVALQAPVYAFTPSSYSWKLDGVRGDTQAYSQALPEDNPLREDLAHDILIAENFRFMEEKDVAAGQRYLDSISAVIQGETSKIRIERKRSVTLAGTKGNLAVDITSDLGYAVDATLRLENASLNFPEGNSIKVAIEPRENRFVFPVNTLRRGSFLVDIVLETNGLVVDGTSTTVNTSIINTLAIILLVGLALIVALVILTKRFSRKLRGGKHAKGRTDQ